MLFALKRSYMIILLTCNYNNRLCTILQCNTSEKKIFYISFLFATGHYWSLQASNPLTQWTVLQYPSAGWLCGFSFDYALRGSSHLTLQATSGEVLWSGVQDTSEAGINWSHISVPDMWIVPDASRRGLQFIVNSVDNQSTVALDNIMLTFCAPCSMDQLQSTLCTDILHASCMLCSWTHHVYE